MKHGFGVQIFSNKNRYFGGWKADQFHGDGTFIFFYGTMFQGTFQNNVRYGKGSMYLPNGDCLTGEWNGSSINNTVFTKGSPKNREATILYQMDYEISNELKRQLNAGYMTKTPRMNDNNSYDSYCLLRWKQYKIIHEDIAQKEQELLAETFCKELKSIQDFKRCISILLDGTYGTVESQMYFKSLVSFFLDLFYGSYYSIQGIRNYQLAMQYAIEDFKSFISSEVWEFFNFLFQEMILNSKEMPIKPNKNTTGKRFKNLLKSDLLENELITFQKECKFECESIIADLLHNKLYDTFFGLYETTYQEEDLLFSQKLDSLQNCKPAEFGVSPEFLPSQNDKEQPFASSIAIMDTLVSKKNVLEKINVLSELRETLFLEIRKHRANNRRVRKGRTGGYSEEDALEDENWQPGADNVTGIETFVFIKSKLRNHYAQFKYINDWKDNNIMLQPVSHLITFYERFLKFVEDIDPSLKNSCGMFISVYSMAKELESAIEEVIKNPELDEIRPSFFNWLPMVLVFVSIEVGRRSGREINQIEIHDDSHGDTSLMANIFQNFEIVSQIMSQAKLLAFDIEVDACSVFVNMFNVLPSRVYSELAFQISKFIRFELEKIL